MPNKNPTSTSFKPGVLHPYFGKARPEQAEFMKNKWQEIKKTKVFPTPTEYMRIYRKTEHHKVYMKKYNSLLREKWPMSKDNWKNQKPLKETELYGETLLKNFGFSNIFKCRDRFIGDFIATKDGKNCLIEVTTAIGHGIKLRINLGMQELNQIG